MNIRKACVLSIILFSMADRLGTAVPPRKSADMRFKPEITFTPGPSDALHNIVDFAVDDKGRVYVLDADRRLVFVFNAKGKLLRKIGADKSGVPIMLMPEGICLGNRGEIIVSDFKCAVFSFSKEGKLLAKSTSQLCFGHIRALGNGRIVARATPMDNGPYRHEIKILNSDLSEVATLSSLLSPQKGLTLDPLWVGPEFAVDAKGLIYFSRRTGYEIVLYDRDGKRMRDLVSKDAPPVAVTEEDKEAASREYMRYGFKLIFARYKAAFQDLSVKDDGWIFVRTWDKTPELGGYFIDVFDRTGREMGKITAFVRPWIWKKGKMYAIEGDGSGGRIVRRYSFIKG